MLESIAQPIIIIPIILGIIIGEVIILIFIMHVSKKTNSIAEKQEVLFQGKSAHSLETVILKQKENLSLMDKEIQELFEISNKLHKLAIKSVHKVGIVRFNPFKEVGSNQSFSIALLDGKDNGITISSIHTREGTRVYAKPILQNTSNAFPLTEEEKQAIAAAHKHKPTEIIPQQ